MFKSLLATVACFAFVSAQTAKTPAPAVATTPPAATTTTATPAAAAPSGPTEEQKKLALASETYCKSTATTKATPAQIIENVKKACALIDKEGAKAFAQFQGDKSAFIFGGTYLVINDFDGVMLLHPMKPEMIGKNFLELKDKNGKLFYSEMVKLSKEKGEGWVDFFWPKAGATEPSQKVSYVNKAKCDGKDVVVSCGIYDVTLADIEKALAVKK
jgi:signal transduction histidine kinase